MTLSRLALYGSFSQAKCFADCLADAPWDKVADVAPTSFGVPDGEGESGDMNVRALVLQVQNAIPVQPKPSNQDDPRLEQKIDQWERANVKRLAVVADGKGCLAKLAERFGAYKEFPLSAVKAALGEPSEAVDTNSEGTDGEQGGEE